MTDTSKLRDGDMPLLARIDAAIRRITSGEGQMRIPVEATDPDVVLFDCRREIERLHKEDAIKATANAALVAEIERIRLAVCGVGAFTNTPTPSIDAARKEERK